MKEEQADLVVRQMTDEEKEAARLRRESKAQRVTRPYFTLASDDYFVCGVCGLGIKTGDFIQRFLVRKRGDRRAWHYDCADPKGRGLVEMATEDFSKEAARGHKSETVKYRRHVRRR